MKGALDELNLAAIRERLRSQQGRQYWRSLEELADTPAFRALLEQEFPRFATFWETPVDRRTVLKLMGASLALAGMAGCGKQPKEEIVPYVRMPEQIIPGKPLYFATAVTRGGYAQGVLVESHMGRPTKVEGNELHPASLGATDSFAQASVLSLYDPDRSQTVLEGNTVSDWTRFGTLLTDRLNTLRQRQGEGLYVLTETMTSPTLGQQLQDLLNTYPRAAWHQYDPVGRNNTRLGSQLAFGDFTETVFRFDRAKVILSLDGDFLGDMPGHVRYGREFIDGRRVRADRPEMNRLYVVEATPSLTGAMADHRRPLRAGRIEHLTRMLANRLGLGIEAGPGELPIEEAWLTAVVKDLQSQPGASLVLTGDRQPPAVHALVHAINAKLGNVGNTVIYTEPVEVQPVDQLASIRELAEAMQAGRVDTLLILGGNPVYDAPVELEFGERLKQVPLAIHYGLYRDETARLCHWHLPATHELESWGDARAYDGTVTLLQPLIAPLFAGRSAYELLAALSGNLNPSGYDILRSYWRQRQGEGDFDAFWRQSLHDGVVKDSATSPAIGTL